MEQVYVFYTRECKPESLTGYAATKESVLHKVPTLRSALQVQYQLGVTSKMAHDIYSKLGVYELNYIGGFEDEEHAYEVINRLEAEKNPVKKEEPKAKPAPEVVTKPEKFHKFKKPVPTADITLDIPGVDPMTTELEDPDWEDK